MNSQRGSADNSDSSAEIAMLRAQIDEVRAWCTGLEERQARLLAALRLLGLATDHV